MKLRKDFLTYVVLLLLGLASAYYVSLSKDEKSSALIEWVAVDPKGVSEVAYKSEKGSVVVDRKSMLAKATTPVDPAKCEAGKDCTAEQVEVFVVSKKFDDVLAGLNPLYVQRKLGKADTLKLEEFGLKAAAGEFTVKVADKTVLNLLVGKKAYGSRSVFAIDQPTNEVLLLNGDLIEDVEKARSRLFRREVLDLDWASVTSAVLSVGDQIKELDHSKRDGAGEKMWTDKGSEQAKPSYKNLMTQLEKLSIQSYASDEKAAELSSLQPFFEVKFALGNRSSMLSLFKEQTGKEIKYWARTSDVNSFASISNGRAEGLEKDLPAIMAP